MPYSEASIRRTPQSAATQHLSLVAGVVLAVSGCVRTYQPLSGLHDPRVVDPTQPNFTDLRIDVYCVPTKGFRASQAAVLCQRVGMLFENQAATVETFTQDPRQLMGDAGLGGADGGELGPPDLVVELRSDEIHTGYHPVTYALSWMTITIVPAVREMNFTQSVIVRDGTGFLLSEATYRGKVVERFGVGTWGGNKILDVLVREDHEDIVGEGANRDLSADLYGQLSQVVFNARMRHEALQMQAPVQATVRP